MQFEQRRISISAFLAGALLTGCGGGSHGAALPKSAPISSTAPAPPYTGPLADTTLKITIPGPTNSAFKRRPAYVSSATKSLKFIINSSTTVSGTATTGTLGTYNGLAWSHFDTGTLPNANCPVDGSHAGNFVCTVTLKLPPGTDNVTISACDVTGGTCAGTSPTGNILSQQITSFAVVVATANSFSVTLDANAGTMAVTATSGFCSGTFTVVNSGSVATVGTTAITFTTAYADLATKTIVAPGLPLLTVNGHTNDNAGAGYTDGTTHLNVKVNQAAQTFTLTQTSGTGSAAVAVTATPPASDGLTFNKTLNFTFVSGAAPPPNFLAVAERLANGNNATTGGQIALYALSLGGSDSFSPASPSSLPSATNGTDSTRHDVDFPNDVLFDPNGDLLIANGGGGDGGGDTGNFSCVPAGSITTGANNATVLTNSNTSANLNNPRFIALLSDSSVALANATAASAKTNDFILSGTYAYSSTRSIPNTGSYSNIGANQVIALPTTAANPAGTYAVAITDGTTQAGNHVVIKRPDGSSVELPSDASDVDSNIGYDAQNNQLVLANSNSTSSKITFWDVATLTKQKTIVIDPDTGGNAVGVPSQAGTVVAVSPTGYVAVSVVCCIGNEVNIYNNNPASRALVSAPIPFDATQSSAGGGFGNDYCYGGTNASTRVLSLRWLPTGGGTYNKLLVGVESTTGSPPSVVTSSANGIYIFDISQAPSSTPVAPNTCTGTTYTYGPMTGTAAAVQPYAKQTGFQLLSGPRPLAAAFKP